MVEVGLKGSIVGRNDRTDDTGVIAEQKGADTSVYSQCIVERRHWRKELETTSVS